MSWLYRMVALSSGAAAGLVLLPSAPAHACSGGSCSPSAFLPESGSLPSNAVEFLWRPSRNLQAGVTPSVQLYKLEAGQRTKLDSEVSAGPDELKRVRPVQPVAPGTTLLLESSEPSCSVAAQVPAQVSVGAASPKPSQLGTLRVTETLAFTTLHIPTAKGVCSDDFDVASARLVLTLDASAQPFAAALQHALLVDGKKRPQPAPTPPRGSWPSFALTRKLEDVLYTLCTQPSDGWTNDVTAGTHRVQWLATLPDGTELRSDEISIQLQCAAQADAGSPADAGGSSDAGAADIAIDAGSERPAAPLPPQADAAAASDAATSSHDAAAVPDARASADDEPESDSGSCALRAPRANRDNWMWLVGTTVVLQRARRRLARCNTAR